MEKIKVFLGMEFGRYDGYEYGNVIKDLDNGYKLVFVDYSDLRKDDDDADWYQILTVKPDDKFGWYTVDGIDFDLEDDGMMYVKRQQEGGEIPLFIWLSYSTGHAILFLADDIVQDTRFYNIKCGVLYSTGHSILKSTCCVLY